MAEEAHDKAALSNIARLMESQKYSDLIIECQRRQWKVHRSIVCSAPDVLAAECDNEMKEKGAGLIKHEEFDTDAVGRIITYINKQTYDVEGEFDVLADTLTDVLADAAGQDPATLENEDNTLAARVRSLEVDTGGWVCHGRSGSWKADSSNETWAAETSDTENQPSKTINQQQPLTTVNDILIAHIEVFGIADYYCIDQLKAFATERFIAVAERSGMQIEGFVNVIKAVNNRIKTDDNALRNALLIHAMKYRNKLTTNRDFMTELAEMEDIQDFVVEMFREVMRLQNEAKRTYQRRLAEKDKERATERANVLLLQTAAHHAEQEQEHTEKVMDLFVASLRNLPETCRNAQCDNDSWSNLTFEMLDSSGIWLVRCGRCKCRLNMPKR